MKSDIYMYLPAGNFTFRISIMYNKISKIDHIYKPCNWAEVYIFTNKKHFEYFYK